MHHVADKVPEDAWMGLKEASDERDVTDFKEVRHYYRHKSMQNLTPFTRRQCKYSRKPFRM